VFAPGFDSERLTRLCGTGVPFRPLFCPIPSCNVPGPKNSFQLRPRDTCGRPHRDSNYPDKQRSIRKKTCSVKLSSKRPCGNKCTSSSLAPPLHVQVAHQGDQVEIRRFGRTNLFEGYLVRLVISDIYKRTPIAPHARHSDNGRFSL